MTSCCPRRELFLEYGRGGPGVRGFWNVPDLGPGLLNRGGPIALFEKADGVTGVFRPGVGAKLGCFRNGDSGRGNDGLPFGLNRGLGARAPGPIDCEKFGRAGGSGLKLGFSVVEMLKLENDGVVGVGGKVSEVRVGEERFVARCIGRNMPDPGTEVVKYRVLQLS